MDQKKLFLFTNEEERLRGFVGTLKGKNQRILYVKYVYILHRIIHKYTSSNREYQAHGAPLNVHDIQLKFGGSCRDVTSIIRNLESWGYIKIKRMYQASKKSTTYKLTEAYEQRKLTMEWFTSKDAKFIQKLLDEWKERMNEPLIQSVLTIFNTKISLSDEGLSFIQEKYNVLEIAQMIAWHRDGSIHNRIHDLKPIIKNLKIEPADFVLISFLLKDFYVTPPMKTKRMFTNLTNLKREYRQFILLNGKPLMETDIVNSQPTFSVPLINQTLKELNGSNHVAQDMKLYENLATTGKFYEALAKEAGQDISDEEQRKLFKREFYEKVFFSRVYKSDNKIKTAFIRLFPSAYTAIKNIKKDDYAKFAVQLQNLEAEMMIYEVLATMIKEGHDVLSIHDSLVVNNLESLRYAESLIQERFQTKYRMQIAFKSKVPVAKYIDNAAKVDVVTGGEHASLEKPNKLVSTKFIFPDQIEFFFRFNRKNFLTSIWHKLIE